MSMTSTLLFLSFSCLFLRHFLAQAGLYLAILLPQLSFWYSRLKQTNLDLIFEDLGWGFERATGRSVGLGYICVVRIWDLDINLSLPSVYIFVGQDFWRPLLISLNFWGWHKAWGDEGDKAGESEVINIYHVCLSNWMMQIHAKLKSDLHPSRFPWAKLRCRFPVMMHPESPQQTVPRGQGLELLYIPALQAKSTFIFINDHCHFFFFLQ